MTAEAGETLIKKGELALKAMFWLFPLIFAAGVWYSSSTQAATRIEAATQSTVTLSKRVEAHEALEAHPVSRTRSDTVQKAVSRIEVEQKLMQVEQRRAAENLSAICQATNANCR